MLMWTVGVIVLWLLTLVLLSALIAWSLCRVGSREDRAVGARRTDVPTMRRTV